LSWSATAISQVSRMCDIRPTWIVTVTDVTRSSAIAEGPRDASCQLKSCQLPRNSAETTCTTSPEEIEVMKLEGYSGPMCNNHVHSTMTRSSRFHCPIGVINKRTCCGYHLHTDDLLWRNFLSPQCRNCSRDPDHAHLGNTHSLQDWHFTCRKSPILTHPTCIWCPRLEWPRSNFAEIFGVRKLESLGYGVVLFMWSYV